MDTTVGRERGTSTRRSTSAVVSLQVLGRILSWLTSLIRLTQEEEQDAGIYLGDSPRN
jgi:hypothetical protein